MHDPRAALAADFIAAQGWQTADRVTIAGDASNRRYERLTAQDGATAVLMDAPPDKGEDTRPFVHVTRLLRDVGLSAPAVIAADETAGFLLLEDLGDDLFARVLERDATFETPLYEAAIDVLVHLHSAPCPDLPPYDAATMTPLAALAFDWYLPGATGTTDPTARSAFATACARALTPLDSEANVLIQRDYHAENLLWLPDRQGIARVGLLDYQDAMRGHAAYDLVSILQDARRDVAPGLAQAMLERYIAATGVDRDSFTRAFACLGMQRNMRILGVFARLSMAYGKAHYVDLIPRVWGHLMASLDHPALCDVAPCIRDALPEPDAGVLQALKAKCGSVAL